MQKNAHSAPLELDYSKLLGFDQLAKPAVSIQAIGAKVGGKGLGKPAAKSDRSLGQLLGARVGGKAGLKPRV